MVTDIFGQELKVGDIVIGTNESSFRANKNRFGIILQLCNVNNAKVGQVNEDFYVDGNESSPIYSATMLVKFTDQAITNYGKENIDLASSVAITFGLDKPPEAKNKTAYVLFFLPTNQPNPRYWQKGSHCWKECR